MAKLTQKQLQQSAASLEKIMEMRAGLVAEGLLTESNMPNVKKQLVREVRTWLKIKLLEAVLTPDQRQGFLKALNGVHVLLDSQASTLVKLAQNMFPRIEEMRQLVASKFSDKTTAMELDDSTAEEFLDYSDRAFKLFTALDEVATILVAPAKSGLFGRNIKKEVSKAFAENGLSGAYVNDFINELSTLDEAGKDQIVDVCSKLGKKYGDKYAAVQRNLVKTAKGGSWFSKVGDVLGRGLDKVLGAGSGPRAAGASQGFSV